MALTKLQTALIIKGQDEAFWCMLADLLSNECYEAVETAYNDACEAIELGEDEGTLIDDEIIDVTGYPIRQVPPIKHGF